MILQACLIAVTAYGKEEDKERGKRAGFDLHLVKPVYPGTILQVLEEMKRQVQSDDGNVVDIRSASKTR
jgi:CheY-like chemotaxis protein